MYLPNTVTQTYNFILPQFDISLNSNGVYDITQNNIKLKNIFANFENNDKPIIESVGTDMTIKSDSTFGIPRKTVIRSHNIANPAQSGDKAQDNGNGLKITVPKKINNIDFSVLWVQVTNKINLPTSISWQTFRVYDLSGTSIRKYYGKYIGGANKLNNIDPNGGTQSDQWDAFEWIPVPIDLTGNTSREIYISNFYSTDTLFSGFAFSTNPWNHAKSSALSLHWRVNNEDTSLGINNSFNISFIF
jgi:hypothetical protein